VTRKIIETDERHERFRVALINALRVEGESLPAEELLAVAAQLVGQLVAMQDQRRYTPAQVMDMVARNVEQGNQRAIAMLLHSSGGTA
jgi:hypothetical protein